MMMNTAAMSIWVDGIILAGRDKNMKQVNPKMHILLSFPQLGWMFNGQVSVLQGGMFYCADL